MSRAHQLACGFVDTGKLFLHSWLLWEWSDRHLHTMSCKHVQAFARQFRWLHCVPCQQPSQQRKHNLLLQSWLLWSIQPLFAVSDGEMEKRRWITTVCFMSCASKHFMARHTFTQPLRMQSWLLRSKRH